MSPSEPVVIETHGDRSLAVDNRGRWLILDPKGAVVGTPVDYEDALTAVVCRPQPAQGRGHAAVR